MSNPTQNQLIRGVRPEVLHRAAEIIRILGHPGRLKIVEVLEGGETAVGEIQAAVGLKQAIVSQHLAKMKAAGILEARRDGQHVYYRVVEPKVGHILNCIRTCDL